MPKFSIIIPVYNAESYLSRCLASVINQTFTDFEIICINDGSTDNSMDILQEYAQKYKNILIVSQENRGLSGARNRGLQNASGDYILFVDSDDYLPTKALEIFNEVSKKTDADIIASNQLFTPNKKTLVPQINKYKYTIHTNTLKDFVKSPKIYSIACNKIYKYNIIKNKKFIEGIYFEDWPFLTTLMGNISKYAEIDAPLYCYDNTHVSITRSDFTVKKIMSYIEGIRYVYSFYKNRDDLKYAQQRYIIALKMCINKVFKSKKYYKELVPVLKDEINKLHEENIITYRHLPLKTKYRLWRMDLVSIKELLTK